MFQSLEHTLGISKENVRILSSAHRTRNLAEYEGGAEFNEQTIEAIIRAAEEISARLPCPRDEGKDNGLDSYTTLAGAPSEGNCAGLLVKPIRL